MTRDIGHIAVSTSPARWADTSSLGSALDTRPFILTGRLAAEIHKCLERKKHNMISGKSSRKHYSEYKFKKQRKEARLCKTGSIWHWKKRDSTSQSKPGASLTVSYAVVRANIHSSKAQMAATFQE